MRGSMDCWNHWYITGYFRRAPLFVVTRPSSSGVGHRSYGPLKAH
jgi:hypothetical protein